MPRLILASASPARARLLTQAGFEFSVMVSGVAEPAEAGVLELARGKAAAVAARVDDGLVLGCDSMFEFDGVRVGKPASADEARQRWRRMRGAWGVLHTGHCLIDAAGGGSAEEEDSTVVRFGDATDAEIDAYVATGEPLGVAGGFTLDNLGAPFVESVEGNPGTVIGVSLPVVRRLLRKLDVSVVDLWR
ncbi:MAG TPA: nucleoside triphosphate pyrophosphatase [Acidimicrobiales bacterium]|jgi:septum formation protein|nr:nucleoside triphosphate pyrophosphatase [Acidimicrobiales bacterium]